MDFVNSKTGLDGINIIGRLQVVRANVALDYGAGEWDEDLMTMVYPEIPGKVACLTEVHPWPYSEDAAGTPFDQANLYGVRSSTWRQPLADGGGDMEYFVAVPRDLPGDYTPVLRYSILLQGFYHDYIGDDPMSGWSWNHRTETGLLWNDDTDPDGYRSQWSPMNLNQEILPSNISDAFSGQWIFYGPTDPFDLPDTLYVVALLASNHIGFRGGKLTFTKANEYPGVWATGSRSYEIVAVPVNEYWDPFDADNDSMVEVLGGGTVSWSFTSVSDPPVVVEHTLGDLRPSNPGIRCNFFIRYPYDGGNISAIYRSSHAFQLSPRTDVPLHYSASMGNRVAPGGYIA